LIADDETRRLVTDSEIETLSALVLLASNETDSETVTLSLSAALVNIFARTSVTSIVSLGC
jgi:hypothetical protein